MYAATWRWHFYAGLFVLPFFLVLALSGALMLIMPSVEPLLYRSLYEVAPAEERISTQQQLEAVQAAYPHMSVVTFVPGATAWQSNRFALMPAHHGGEHGGHTGQGSFNVYVNPYSGELLGKLDPQSTLYAFARGLHGTLLLGQTGDYLIEIVAGFGVLLVITGLFLWWPRGHQSWRELLWPRRNGGKRAGWRSLHAGLGFWMSGLLLFFLFSGLAWTSVWGGKMLQGWGSMPPQKLQTPLSERRHAALNYAGEQQVPWTLEQTAMPLNPAASGNDAARPDLNDISRFAAKAGLPGYRIFLPQNQSETWTLSSTTINGDIRDPRRDTTLYIDQHSGELLAAARFADYPLLGKAMAAGVSLHQGGLGFFNLLLNLLFCLVVLTMVVAAFSMWWIRKPRSGLRLSPPPMPASPRIWRQATLIMLILALLFPLTGLTILAVLLIDALLTTGLKALRTRTASDQA